MFTVCFLKLTSNIQVTVCEHIYDLILKCHLTLIW